MAVVTNWSFLFTKRRLFAENWIRVFGPPRVILIDQAQTNMGEALQDFLDLQQVVP